MFIGIKLTQDTKQLTGTPKTYAGQPEIMLKLVGQPKIFSFLGCPFYQTWHSHKYSIQEQFFINGILLFQFFGHKKMQQNAKMWKSVTCYSVKHIYISS